MSSLFLAPHNDDEVLFGAYTLLRYHPTVVVCLAGTTQAGVTAIEREMESKWALIRLGVKDFRQWEFPDSHPNWAKVRLAMFALRDDFDIVFAPMIEDGGHEQHNMIGELALEVFGVTRVTGYATYRRGSGRTRTAREVEFEPEWPALKLAAMACYRSQIQIENTRPWFFDADAQREWWSE